MKNKIIFSLLILIMTGCKYFRGDNCNNTLSIVGKYENTFDKKATNYLIINEDGTFKQIFTKGEVVKKNSGTWEFFQKSCNIRFKNLKLLHKLPKSTEEFFTENGKFRLNNIVFFEDVGYAFDFFRIKD